MIEELLKKERVKITIGDIKNISKEQFECFYERLTIEQQKELEKIYKCFRDDHTLCRLFGIDYSSPSDEDKLLLKKYSLFILKRKAPVI